MLYLSLNFLESKLTRFFFIVLEFFISRVQAICKTYLLLLHYIIVVMAN